MNSGMFGEGSLALGWTTVEGRNGLVPRLALKGELIAKGYGHGAVIQLSVDVTALDVIGSSAFLGTTTPKPYVLNWIKQQFVESNPSPADETIWSTEVFLPLDVAIIEGLEERRQGKDFTLQLDTHVLMIDRGVPLTPPPPSPVHYQVHPTMDWQDQLRVSQNDWGQVLVRWERGVNIPLIVPLPELHPAQNRADIVRHLRTAQQKIDGGDYSGAIAEARKALELLRELSPAIRPLPKSPPERDALQRIHAVIDALYSLASAPPHVDEAVKNFEPMRADAVMLVASTAAATQEIFAHLKLL